MPRYARRQSMVPSSRANQPRRLALRNELHRVFDDYFHDYDRQPLPKWELGAEERFDPSVDVHDTNGELLVFVELPGLSHEDVEVEIDEDTVVVSGEKKVEQGDEKGGRSWRESLHGAFEREIPLPATIDIGKAEATFRHGVLRISLPKLASEPARRRRLEVREQAGEGGGT